MTDYVISDEMLETAENKATNGYGDCMIPREIIDAIHSRPLSDELAKERERVLDKINQYVESYRSYREDGTLAWTCLIFPDHIDELIKTLRGAP